MKGCFDLILKTILLILIFFGLKYIGIVDFVSDKINKHINGTDEEQIIQNNEIVDLSQIDNEYVVDKSLKFFDNKVILAQHKASGQKMLMILPKKENLITKEDITSDNIQEKADNLIRKYQNKILKIDKIDVSEKGYLKGINQTIPYIKVKAEISNLPIKDIEGIIGVAKLNNDKNLIIISISEKDKYSQIITEVFYNKVRDNTLPNEQK